MTGRRKPERSTRRKLSSPGRPPVWQREHLCRFWREIAAGLSSEDAAVAAGVSPPVGTRWFRSAGGMPPTHLSPSAILPKGRSLCFSEREKIALDRARGTGVRAIARKLGRSPSTISREIRRNPATRSGAFDYRALAAQWHADRAASCPRHAFSMGVPRPASSRSIRRGATTSRINCPGSLPRRTASPSMDRVVWKGRRAVHRQSRRWSSARSPEPGAGLAAP